MTQGVEFMPWDEFLQVNNFYMVKHRGWRLCEASHDNTVRYVFPESLHGALDHAGTLTLAAILLQAAECHFTRTRRGLRIRIITSGAPGGCRKHDSASFRVEMRKVSSVARLVETIEERATATATAELAYCLIFGACATGVAAQLESEAANRRAVD
ncbi:hypothetical protein BS329_39910 [Amycolatopsis coloradensis]|uniref:Uncharacterized protein n=1 Tax=Amycolatopsis coloradensis TaxID=76021 RepID=A0A1R0KDY4_9PSEU|nr:hypothetical protein [Amycolatopsis coloradensis]OLZ43256.1 hypothetical protein BS329_39910 [Amycolatopsis coloradensis]